MLMIARLTMPVVLSMSIMIPASTTHDRKWGRYVKVCTVRLNTVCLISFNISAKRDGEDLRS